MHSLAITCTAALAAATGARSAPQIRIDAMMLQTLGGRLASVRPCCLKAALQGLLRGLHTSTAQSEPRELVAGQPTHYTHPEVRTAMYDK